MNIVRRTIAAAGRHRFALPAFYAITVTTAVQAVNDVALTLGKEVIAEGVECEEHAAVLREIGVEHGQGFHWGQPSGRLDRHGLGAGFAVPHESSGDDGIAPSVSGAGTTRSSPLWREREPGTPPRAETP